MVKAKTKELKNQKNEEPEKHEKKKSGKISIKQAKERLKVLRERIQFWKKIKWPVITIGSLLFLFLIIFAVYSISYAKTTYRNVYVGDINLSKKSKDEIASAIRPKTEDFQNKELVLKYQPEEGDVKEYKFASSDIGLSFDLDKTAKDVYAVGRSGNIFRSFYQQFKTLFVKYRVEASYSINEDALEKKIADIGAEVDVPEKDFGLKYIGSGVFELTTEKQEGKRIEQEKIISTLKSNISNIKSEEISFKSQIFKPQISEENAKIGLENANKILAAGELNLTYNNQSYNLDVDTIAGLIGSRPKKKKMEIFIISDKAQTQVAALAAQIDKPAGNAILAVDNGKVVVSSESKNGLVLDQSQTKISIENALLARFAEESKVNYGSASLKVELISPEIDSTKLASYGLTELVASGTTNFVKSPANRIHNINVGASAITGTLIKPGEEFSTLKKLGKIDASTGYLPELVIKNNKTVPDYGGGLCQVSTTLFRAALNAGMKITERRNHSYRVSYYEPPIGMDASIFDPAPDFKFVNNYSNYIFVQARIVGTKITFELYGTKDSRTVEVGQAVGYDYVEPSAPVENVDPALPAGTRNQVQKSHQGASAKFHYKVMRDGQTLQETDFLSKYVALPEIWQVGPPAPAPAPEATPTPAP